MAGSCSSAARAHDAGQMPWDGQESGAVPSLGAEVARQPASSGGRLRGLGLGWEEHHGRPPPPGSRLSPGWSDVWGTGQRQNWAPGPPGWLEALRDSTWGHLIRGAGCCPLCP